MIIAEAHSRVGNPRFEQTCNTIQCSNPATVTANFPFKQTDKNQQKIVGIYKFLTSFKEADRHSASDVKLEQLNRHGAEAARRAHNPEVTRSKRVAGIITI